jgi:serine protease Do
VLVAGVMPDSPADAAGLKTGDVIVEFEGQKTGEVQELQRVVGDTPPGTAARVTILRDGRRQDVSVKIGEMPPDEPVVASRGTERWGLSVQPITPELARQFKLPSSEGVLVSEVEDGSPAARAGIRPGDAITEVNRRRVRDLKSFEDALGAAEQDVVVFIQREGRSRYVVLKPEGR